MTSPTPSLRELARRLAQAQTAPSEGHAGTLVNDNLRLTLSRFAGSDGFASLVRRSLSLAGTSIPGLKDATVGADGHIALTDQISAAGGVRWQEASVAVTAQLLELLVAFIGEPLTRRLVREACPEVSVDG